jgi:hypothetical protein
MSFYEGVGVRVLKTEDSKVGVRSFVYQLHSPAIMQDS